MKFMTLKEQINLDIEDIQNPNILNQIQAFIKLVKRNIPNNDKNIKAVLANAGSISDQEAKKLHCLINNEFNNIEGDW